MGLGFRKFHGGVKAKQYTLEFGYEISKCVDAEEGDILTCTGIRNNINYKSGGTYRVRWNKEGTRLCLQLEGGGPLLTGRTGVFEYVGSVYDG